MARLRIFTGHFGSGKTEISLNYALQLAQRHEHVCLVDLDIVNPYFCSRDASTVLAREGIRLISSSPSLSNAELAVVSPEVYSVFNDRRYEVVMDVGGDDLGAVALGQYQRYFHTEPYDMYFVINTRRPQSTSRQDILGHMERIEAASRLKITHFVANTNLSFDTTEDDVLAGDDFVSKLARERGVPHAYTVCTANLIPSLQGRTAGKLFGIQLFMKTPWM